jgi:hypothetical protein
MAGQVDEHKGDEGGERRFEPGKRREWAKMKLILNSF